MRTAVVLLAFVGVAYAGVGTLSPEEEDAVLQTLINPCLSGSIPESGKLINGVWVYCKQSPDVNTQRFERERSVVIRGGEQTVLVRPPQQRFEHKLKVNAVVQGGKTRIYVVPQRPDNSYQIEVTPNTEQPQKPTVYFLKKTGQERESLQAQAPKSRYADYDQ